MEFSWNECIVLDERSPNFPLSVLFTKACVVNLCGHTHTRDRFADADKGWIYHCELDAHDMRPVTIDEILADIDRRF